MKTTYAFHYLINTPRFKIAWHSFRKWKKYDGSTKAYFFSLTNRKGYATTLDRYAERWQLCILGLNVGYVYKMED
jgi:hypothetical protein